MMTGPGEFYFGLNRRADSRRWAAHDYRPLASGVVQPFLPMDVRRRLDPAVIP